MSEESIYGEYLPKLILIKEELEAAINSKREEIKDRTGMDPVEHCLSRIKSEDSMREKLKRQNLEETTENALFTIHDAIGVRVVCPFLHDVYMMRDMLSGLEGFETVEEKDYIRHAKPNGYRSLHLILKAHGLFYAEIQLRTISMDTWAALEHNIRYKRNISGNTELIGRELKRCADELASTDG